jgi:hypothetical protein
LTANAGTDVTTRAAARPINAIVLSMGCSFDPVLRTFTYATFKTEQGSTDPGNP